MKENKTVFPFKTDAKNARYSVLFQATLGEMKAENSLLAPLPSRREDYCFPARLESNAEKDDAQDEGEMQ